MNVEAEYTTSVPHGGALVNRRAPRQERRGRQHRGGELPHVALGARAPSALWMIARGYSGELRLWVVGERPWDQCVAGLAGRVRRRLPAPETVVPRR